MISFKKEEREINNSELRDILSHANEFEWEQYFPRMTTRVEIAQIDTNHRLERNGQEPKPLNPDRYLSAPCYWTMICSQYFPYAGYKLAADDLANAEMIEELKSSLSNSGEGLPPLDEMKVDSDMGVEQLQEREESKMIEEKSEEKAIEMAEVNWFKTRVKENLNQCVI